jgi:uncharacterized protein (DUF1501 family)
MGSVVPSFIANTARAAEKGKDSILVVVELNGGNDGLNTVIPHGDDLYHKYRPTLKFDKNQVIKVNDHIGLHPGLSSFRPFLEANQLAIIQGVGYPNPDRSHFESMDIWQSADPKRQTKTGWLGRTVANIQDARGGIPMLHIGGRDLPLALQGAPGGAISVNHQQSYGLNLGGGNPEERKARQALLEKLSQPEKQEDPGSLLQFVQRRQVQTLTTLDKLQDLLRAQNQQENFFREGRFYGPRSLPVQMQLVARLIQREFGTRIFYVMRDGFDTHSNQAGDHQKLLAEVADSIGGMFEVLKQTGHDKQVRVLTFSEFGRRVRENGSKGTDHGSGSCMFLAGPSVKGGLVGEHPSLEESKLDDGDLRYHTDFRSVYATLLDDWLGCPSEAVLNGKFEHVKGLKG